MQMSLIIASDYYDRSYSPRIPPPPHPPFSYRSIWKSPEKASFQMSWNELNSIYYDDFKLTEQPTEVFFYQLCYGLLPLYLEHLIS